MNSDSPGIGWRRRLLRQPLPAWGAVALYTVLLYSTPGLLNTWYRWAFRELGGRQATSLWINVLFALIGILVLALLRRRRGGHGLGQSIALLLIGLATAACLWRLEVPAKRLHFLQYAPLTLMVLHAFGRSVAGRSRYVWVLLLVTAIGAGDEWVQSRTPNRYFGLLDIGVNAVAAALTLAFAAFVWTPSLNPSRDAARAAPTRRPPALRTSGVDGRPTSRRPGP